MNLLLHACIAILSLWFDKLEWCCLATLICYGEPEVNRANYAEWERSIIKFIFIHELLFNSKKNSVLIEIAVIRGADIH